ncbi:MAG: gas vesicle protein GvpG [Acidobacteriia bacterium]|nr:gas vesicle protein GvpG [Terriglobia bacterium]
MVLVDDLLMFPIRSVLWVFREIHNAAQEELATEAESITAELSDLYMRLETGRISEEEFAAEEKVLLDRLERAQQRGRRIEAAEGGEGSPEESAQRRAA